jgi:hypothetical protein
MGGHGPDEPVLEPLLSPTSRSGRPLRHLRQQRLQPVFARLHVAFGRADMPPAIVAYDVATDLVDGNTTGAVKKAAGAAAVAAVPSVLHTIERATRPTAVSPAGRQVGLSRVRPHRSGAQQGDQ